MEVEIEVDNVIRKVEIRNENVDFVKEISEGNNTLVLYMYALGEEDDIMIVSNDESTDNIQTQNEVDAYISCKKLTYDSTKYYYLIDNDIGTVDIGTVEGTLVVMKIYV